MSFYQTLSRYYDEIFPAGEKEMAFVNTLLEGKTRLLDVGCGTGNKTIALAKGRELVSAFDLDEGMVEKARARPEAKTINFLALDMLDLEKVFAPPSFDAVVCLGNTLAHLTEAGTLGGFIRQVRSVLQPGGIFVAQLLNYSRIIEQKIDRLPLVETEHVVFDRGYEWRGCDMHFVTELRVKATGERFENDIVLRPIVKFPIDGALEAAGFGLVNHYGSYAGEPYRADSYHLIFKAAVD